VICHHFWTYSIEKHLKNLVAKLWFELNMPYYPNEYMAMSLHQPVTSATLFGCIAFTPACYRSVNAKPKAFKRAEQSHSTSPHRLTPYSRSEPMPRELFHITVEKGARLLSSTATTSSWTTPVKLVGTKIAGEWEEDC
jgi:hypothetical protein